MEFEDPEEQEEELCMGEGAGYDPTRIKMPGDSEPMMVAPTLRTNNNNNGSNNGGGGGGNNSNNSSMVVKARYRECLKNHAVTIGGHALDGCGEFMPAGADGTLDALKCAACNCHRNFHRKETESPPAGDSYLLTHHPHPYHHHYHQPPPPFSAYYRSPAGYLNVVGQHRGPLALPSTSGAGVGGGGGGGGSRDMEQEDVSNPSGGGGGGGGSGGGGGGSSRKRFRTKFTQEQKEKMLELAEKLGWRIQKHDEAAVLDFCNETGVRRNVLKVWMHNNKHTLGGQAFLAPSIHTLLKLSIQGILSLLSSAH